MFFALVLLPIFLTVLLVEVGAFHFPLLSSPLPPLLLWPFATSFILIILSFVDYCNSFSTLAENIFSGAVHEGDFKLLRPGLMSHRKLGALRVLLVPKLERMPPFPPYTSPAMQTVLHVVHAPPYIPPVNPKP